MTRAAQAPDDEEIRDACIQRFEFSFELSWKMLKRRLAVDLPSSDAVEAMNYRSLIRVGADRGLVHNPSKWFEYRDLRNLSSHTYDPVVANQVFSCIAEFQADAQASLAALIVAGASDA